MRYLLCCVLLFLVSPAWAEAQCSSDSVQILSSQLAAGLVDTLQVRLDRTQPVASTSFVDLHHLDQSSAIGRILGELSSNAFASYGYTMIEARLRVDSVSIQDGVGELALSRSLRLIPGKVPAQAILTGNYARIGNALHVSARLIDAQSHAVLATATCRLRLSPDTLALLSPDPAPKAPEPTAAITLLRLTSKADVRIIQHQLKSLGLYGGKIDGIWGRKSRAALATFRKVHGLGDSSAWDEATQRTLIGS
ncbi:MAG: peptidoglycan-binding protein [Desulfovibrionales bacterium]|nr:peptidoglycan-binding protein [Desulfovibrionales bacterium]